MNFACNIAVIQKGNASSFSHQTACQKRNDDFSFHQHYIPMNE